MVDAQDLKSCVQLDVWVQVPQFAPLMFVLTYKKTGFIRLLYNQNFAFSTLIILYKAISIFVKNLQHISNIKILALLYKIVGKLKFGFLYTC